MFTKKTHADVKKLTLKIQDCKKDTASRLRHLKTILGKDCDIRDDFFLLICSPLVFVLIIQMESSGQLNSIFFTRLVNEVYCVRVCVCCV